MDTIFVRKDKTVETVRHKAIEYVLGMNETMESKLLWAFGTLLKRDFMGWFEVGIIFFVVTILCRFGIIAFEDSRSV